jgi:hypothetical protein
MKPVVSIESVDGGYCVKCELAFGAWFEVADFMRFVLGVDPSEDLDSPVLVQPSDDVRTIRSKMSEVVNAVDPCQKVTVIDLCRSYRAMYPDCVAKDNSLAVMVSTLVSDGLLRRTGFTRDSRAIYVLVVAEAAVDTEVEDSSDCEAEVTENDTSVRERMVSLVKNLTGQVTLVELLHRYSIKYCDGGDVPKGIGFVMAGLVSDGILESFADDGGIHYRQPVKKTPVKRAKALPADIQELVNYVSDMQPVGARIAAAELGVAPELIERAVEHGVLQLDGSDRLVVA